jgi:hypothetical protein
MYVGNTKGGVGGGGDIVVRVSIPQVQLHVS